jgi:glycosyltransferase involved in cell wall biosynthesis
MVSIVVPNYNNAKFLPECIESCLKVPNAEIIVADDASTDNSVEIAKGFGVYVIEATKNEGVSVARNAGIIRSMGDFIICMDSDDMIIPESVEPRVKRFEEKPELDVIYGAMKKEDGSLHPSIFTAPMYRRSVFQRFGLFHAGLRSKEDKEMVYRLGVHAKSYCGPRVSFERVDYPVMFYRRHEGAKRKRRVKDMMFDIETCMEFDRRCKDIEINGITKSNTRFLE